MRSRHVCVGGFRPANPVPMYLHCGFHRGSYCGNIPMAVAMRLRVGHNCASLKTGWLCE